MKKTIKMNERELHRLISESVKRVLNEHEDDWFEEYDTAYIDRTSAYYGDTDDNDFYTPDYWTYSTSPNDKDFAGDIYVLDDDGKIELNWWIRCQNFNGYQRRYAFNPNNKNPEDMWNYLVKNFATKIENPMNEMIIRNINRTLRKHLR